MDTLQIKNTRMETKTVPFTIPQALKGIILGDDKYGMAEHAGRKPQIGQLNGPLDLLPGVISPAHDDRCWIPRQARDDKPRDATSIPKHPR